MEGLWFVVFRTGPTTLITLIRKTRCADVPGDIATFPTEQDALDAASAHILGHAYPFRAYEYA
jgi:hypothetical protein